MDDKSKLLELLDSKKNVLLMGAPGTGKSRIMNEVAEAFINGGTRIAQPSHVPRLFRPCGPDTDLPCRAKPLVLRGIGDLL